MKTLLGQVVLALLATNYNGCNAFSQRPFVASAPRSTVALNVMNAQQDDRLKAENFSSSQADGSKLKLPDLNAIDWQQKLKDIMGNFDTSGLQQNSPAIVSNMIDGDFGKRGEVQVIAQFALIFCILIGGLPIFGGSVFLISGLAMFIVGLAMTASAALAMGPMLSPWTTPSEKGAQLITTGLFSQMRHPIYSGLLCTCAGFSIITGSADRLLMTALLWYLLDIKSDKEEVELMKTFPGYADYMYEVPSKFVSIELLEQLKWTRE